MRKWAFFEPFAIPEGPIRGRLIATILLFWMEFSGLQEPEPHGAIYQTIIANGRRPLVNCAAGPFRGLRLVMPQEIRTTGTAS